MYGLAGKAEALGVRVLTGVTVTGFDYGHNAEAVAAVETDRGRIACEQIVIGTGPWVRDFWDMLDLPKKIAGKGRDGVVHDDVPMWRFWQVQAGDVGGGPGHRGTRAGANPHGLAGGYDAPLTSGRHGQPIQNDT